MWSLTEPQQKFLFLSRIASQECLPHHHNTTWLQPIKFQIEKWSQVVSDNHLSLAGGKIPSCWSLFSSIAPDNLSMSNCLHGKPECLWYHSLRGLNDYGQSKSGRGESSLPRLSYLNDFNRSDGSTSYCPLRQDPRGTNHNSFLGLPGK